MSKSAKNSTLLPPPSVSLEGSFKPIQDPVVTVITSMGAINFKIDPTSAPITASNILQYVNDGFYTGTLVHRVIPKFVVQMGGFTTGLTEKTPTYPSITLESNNGLSNVRGSLGMARTAAPDSATSQFYVNLSDNKFLDYSSTTKPGYAVFGQVVTGMNVIDNIAKQPTKNAGLLSDVPVAEITITSAIAATAYISNVGTVALAGLEAGTKWAYSTNNGNTWITGKGTGFRLAEGTYTAGSIKVRQADKAGNVSTSSEIDDKTLIVDRTAPALTAYGPGNLVSGADPTNDIVITFSEGVFLGAGVIKLKNKSGNVVESFSVTASNSPVFSYTINPANDLGYGAVYSLDIRSLALTDIAGNKFTGSKKALSFTTTDTITTADTSYILGTECNKLTYSGTASFTGYGNEVANTIKSGNGGSSLFGLAGNDLLFGGAGVDILYGGIGSDTLTSGSGNDYFVLSSPTDKGSDLFVDFAQGEDKIALIGKNFPGLPSTLAAGDLLASSNATKPTSGQRLIYNSTSGALYFDADGLASTPAIKLAIVGKLTHPVLTLTDFFIG